MLMAAEWKDSEPFLTGWPLTWAPQGDYWMKTEFDESRRIYDRYDAPQVVVWRGLELKRDGIMIWGTCYGFCNKVAYDDDLFHGELCCDGGRAWIEFEIDCETATLAAEGADEQAALDALAVKFAAWAHSFAALLEGKK